MSSSVRSPPPLPAAAGVSFDEAAQTGRFEGQAADKRTQSRVKGTADFGLGLRKPSGTAVTVTVDYALTGSLAQFSRGGIVRELAAALTAQFAQNLAARLRSVEAAVPPDRAAGPSVPAPAIGPTPVADPAQALSVLDLLARSLRAGWRSWMHRFFARPKA